MKFTQTELLAVELAAIEKEAATKTLTLLANQETFQLAHDLAELLKANGAPYETKPSVVYYSSSDRPGFVIYANHREAEPEAVLSAIQDTRLPYRVADGYAGSVRCIHVEGFDGVEITLPAAFFPAALAQQGAQP